MERRCAVRDTPSVDLRNRIAHAATPWDWRSRRRVEAVVGIAVLWGVVALIGALVDSRRAAIGGLLFNVLSRAMIWFFLAMRPALRCLRRWDQTQQLPAAAVIPC